MDVWQTDVRGGVRVQGGDVIEADTVILAAGANGSPAILLRSGIGSSAQLREFDLPIVVDLPGVGANLVDHPQVAVDLPAAPGRRGPAFRCCSACAPRWPARRTRRIYICSWRGLRRLVGPQRRDRRDRYALLSPRSRGSLRLRSADSADPPRIDPAYPGLRDAAVALSLALATALERIVQDQGLTAGDLVDVWFPNDDSGRLRRVFTPTG